MSDFLPYFRTLPLFTGVPDDAILAIAQRLTRRRLMAGQTLYHSGDPLRAAWFVIKGSIEILSAGGRQVLVVPAGGAICLAGLFTGHPPDMTSIAMDETWLLELDRDLFLQACEGTDPFGRLLVERVVMMLAHQLRRFDSALLRLEASAVAKARKKGRAAECVPEDKPAQEKLHRPPPNATDAELMEWAAEMAKRSGIDDLDKIKVVQGPEIPIRRGPIS